MSPLIDIEAKMREAAHELKMSVKRQVLGDALYNINDVNLERFFSENPKYAARVKKLLARMSKKPKRVKYGH